MTRSGTPTHPARTRLKAVIATSIGICIGSAAGAVLPFVLTHLNGVGRATDVYFIVLGGMQIAAYLVGLVAESTALPVFAEATTTRADTARPMLFDAMRHLAGWCALFNVVAVALVVLVVLPASGVSWWGEDRALVFVLCAAPLPFCAAMSGLSAAANYSVQRYGVTAASQACRAGVALVLLLVSPREFALCAAAAGLWLGEIGRAVLLCSLLPKGTPQGAAFHAGVTDAIVKLAGPTLASSAIVAFNPIIDKAVAARVGLGAPTILELAEKVYYIPSVLLVAAISKVYTAQWSRMAATDAPRIRPDYRRIQRLCLLVGASAATLFAWFGSAVLQGPLPARVGVSIPPGFLLVLVIFLAGLPFAMSSDLSNSVIIILRRAYVMPRIAIGLVALNVVGDIVGAHLWGVAGIAVSSTLVRVAGAAAAMLFAVRALAAVTDEDR